MKRIIILAAILASCSGSQMNPESDACAGDDFSDAALAQIEIEYVAEIVTACNGQHFDTCDARPSIDAKYDAIRQRWVRCQK